MKNYVMLPFAGLFAVAAMGLSVGEASAAVPGIAAQTLTKGAPAVEQVYYRYHRRGYYGSGAYYGGRYCNRTYNNTAAAAGAADIFGSVAGGLLGIGAAAAATPGYVLGGYGYGYGDPGYGYGYSAYPGYGYGYGTGGWW